MNSSLDMRAREAILSGRLPAQRPARSWAGMGSGARCLVCMRPMTHEEVELELEFIEASPSEAPRCCRVHAQCFAAWEAECHKLAARS